MFQIEDINKEIARKNKIDIKLVTEVNYKQWREVELAMKNHLDSNIKIPALGTMIARFSPTKKHLRRILSVLKEKRLIENPSEFQKNYVESLQKQFRNIWKIKNDFALNNIRIKNKKLNKENE
jgi:hypothetical protein